MPYLPRGVREQAELMKRIDALAPWPPGVVNVRYKIEDDWSGEPALFFRITLADEAAQMATIGPTGRRVRDFIKEQLDPLRQWDLFPYVNFQSQSEEEKFKEEVSADRWPTTTT